MRLITKINLALLGVVAVSAVLNFAALRMAVMPSFASLEEQAADRNQGRVLEAIELHKEQVANSAGDYAIWDDTYAFMRNEATDYVDKNVTAESLKTLGVNYFVAVDNEGHIVLDSGYRYGEEEPSPLRLFASNQLLRSHPFLEATEDVEVRSALLSTDQGLVVVGYAPILMSDRSGERAGTLVLGRILDADALRSATKVDFEFKAPEKASEDLGVSGQEFLYRVDQLTSVEGKPLTAVISRTGRDITAVGERTILTTLLFLLGGAALLLFALGYVLRKIAVSRIEMLRAHLSNVASTGKLEALPDDGRNDELSEAIQAFNDMAQQLAELRDKLRRQDYDHGAADQAAGLLHNVRNAMSPVSVLAWELSKEGQSAVSQNLTKALEQLKDPEIAQDRAAKLNQFVTMSATRLIEDEAERRNSVRSMVDMLRHIDDILKDSERSAQLERAVESIDLDKSMRDAVQLVERRAAVDLGLSHLDGNLVLGHKVPFDQVLANILVNAAEAIEASGSKSGKILVTSEIRTRGQGAREVAMMIRDDGVGIDRGSLQHIFEKGFSTKSEGKRGLGLHWCANVMNAMGGRVVVESEGAGRGACVTVTLPAATESKAAA
ncbi:hypothetical protein ASG19_07340 [Rhizobium sp. Leaf306]|uniref:CHASE4 domain-containing protein n=1 Tax=Rhizobium sp. Leaf306 TaxID=1736330 RepID=UPI0007162B17|nr:CHASE4 domain-containing protein [Rhizobium sp. Leaf306]KQQ38814.1 hypothetical protein ASG19_07340 [Rhizobium sp. Leaf306]